MAVVNYQGLTFNFPDDLNFAGGSPFFDMRTGAGMTPQQAAEQYGQFLVSSPSTSMPSYNPSMSDSQKTDLLRSLGGFSDRAINSWAFTSSELSHLRSLGIDPTTIFNKMETMPTVTDFPVSLPGLTPQQTQNATGTFVPQQSGGMDIGWLLSMSDDDLMAYAGQMGIDTSPFSLGAFPTSTPTEFGGPMGLGVGAPQITMSPEVRAEVANIYNAQRTKGNEELLRMGTTLAGRRGLNLYDTPIADPLLRQKAAFESELGGLESGAMLGLNESMRSFLQGQAVQRESALQSRFGLQEGQRQFGENFGENIRQFQTEQGRLAENQQRSFLQNIYSTQETLAQQAFANRLQLANQSGQLASNLAGQRLGFGTGQTTTAPTNVGAGIGAIGAGFQSLFGQPQTSFTINPNFQPNSSSMFIPSTQTSLFG